MGNAVTRAKQLFRAPSFCKLMSDLIRRAQADHATTEFVGTRNKKLYEIRVDGTIREGKM